jgi:hypothetical protein
VPQSGPLLTCSRRVPPPERRAERPRLAAGAVREWRSEPAATVPPAWRCRPSLPRITRCRAGASLRRVPPPERRAARPRRPKHAARGSCEPLPTRCLGPVSRRVKLGASPEGADEAYDGQSHRPDGAHFRAQATNVRVRDSQAKCRRHFFVVRLGSQISASILHWPTGWHSQIASCSLSRAAQSCRSRSGFPEAARIAQPRA